MCIVTPDDLQMTPRDAVVGGLIGFLSAYFCYRQHYPPFLHAECHLPYASLAANANAAAAARLTSHPPLQDEQPTDNSTTLPLEGLNEGPV
ncbi:unnamed protein product [Boreogadus saida]